ELRVEIRRPDVPLLERAGPEVLDDDVGLAGEPAEQVLAVGLAEVERDAPPAASLDGPEQRVARALLGGRRRIQRIRRHERPDLAHEVAGARLLDLHELGALLGQQPGAERRGDAGTEVEHPQARERPAHGDFAPACSCFTASMPPCLRASVAWSAVAVFDTNWCTMKWYRHDSRWPWPSTMWLMTSLIASAVTGGTRAVCSASSRTAASSSSRGTTRFTSPNRSAVSASSFCAHHRNSFALRGPSSHGSTRSSTPTPVIRATGFENIVSSAATMRSHMHASIIPAAATAPCTAAIVGWGKPRPRTHMSPDPT